MQKYVPRNKHIILLKMFSFRYGNVSWIENQLFIPKKFSSVYILSRWKIWWPYRQTPPYAICIRFLSMSNKVIRSVSITPCRPVFTETINYPLFNSIGLVVCFCGTLFNYTLSRFSIHLAFAKEGDSLAFVSRAPKQESWLSYLI